MSTESHHRPLTIKIIVEHEEEQDSGRGDGKNENHSDNLYLYFWNVQPSLCGQTDNL